jgi:hypothetical protein
MLKETLQEILSWVLNILASHWLDYNDLYNALEQQIGEKFHQWE